MNPIFTAIAPPRSAAQPILRLPARQQTERHPLALDWAAAHPGGVLSSVDVHVLSGSAVVKSGEPEFQGTVQHFWVSDGDVGYLEFECIAVFADGAKLEQKLGGRVSASIDPDPDTPQAPDAFSFTDVTDADLSTQQTSNLISVAGLGSGVSVPVSVSGGTYSKNGGSYTASEGAAQNGDTFRVRHTSSASYETAVNTTLAIGGVSDTFTSTTEADVTAPTVGGIAIGSEGEAGTLYEGLKLIEGDDFTGTPSRWSGRNLSGKYAHSALSVGFRQTSTNDSAMYVDPAFRGARSQSPTDLGVDRVAVASSVLTLTASAPEAEVLPFLPTVFTGGRGDGSNRPRLLTGSLKTAPSFMLSAQADWIVEFCVRLPAGIARGYWPSGWTTSFFWPDDGEVDIIEVKKDASGDMTSLMNIFGNSTDGGSAEAVTVAQPSFPADQWIKVLAKRVGNTISFYDDADNPGTYALRGSSSSYVARLSGAHDIRLDLAVSNVWDNSTFSAEDWPKSVEFDWWRVWVPSAAGANKATQILPAVNTTPGGSWAATFPSAVDLHGAGAGLEQVNGAFDNFDAPGYPTRNSATRLPTSMTVDLEARTISGTVPITEGGCLPVLITYAYDDGTPASRVMLPFNVAPALQSIFANQTIVEGAELSLTVGYTAFHSGNLGPHVYTVSSDKGWVTITGNGTQEVTITGTAPADDVATLTINCTNIRGQTTTVTRTVTAEAAPAYASWTGPGWFDASDASKVTVNGANQVATLVNKRPGGGDMVGGGFDTKRVYVSEAKNGLNALRITRDTGGSTATRFTADSTTALAQAFQGDDKPCTVLFVFTPTDSNTRFLWSASNTLGATSAESFSAISRVSPNSTVRRNPGTGNTDVNYGSGHAADTPRIIAIRFNGTTEDVWDTSTSKIVSAAAQDTAPLSSGVNFHLFADENGGSNDPNFAGTQGDMDFYEIIVEGSAKSDADIEQAITDLAEKWGITLS